MSNNIIDFNEHRQNKDNGPREEAVSLDDIMENLDSMPDNGLMSSAAHYVNGHMMKLLSLMDIGKRVSELLDSIGLDPDDFSLNEDSMDRYLIMEGFKTSPTPFNGPWFDCFTDDAQIRVVTAFQEDDDAETFNVMTAVLKLEDGADCWQRYSEDGWIEDGPPADFFDVMDEDDWDDEDWDDDDELLRQEPWEDEYDDSIYALYLSPQTYRALSRAGIETAERLRQLTDLELLAIDGIGSKELSIIHEALDDLDLADDDDE